MSSTFRAALRSDGTTALADPYQQYYRPLKPDGNHIRLLTIQPDHGCDAVHCNLQAVSSADDPSYETVSYYWGDPTKQDCIILNGSNVRVPASSCAALYRLRLPNHARTLWIDAVCINQADFDERCRQLSIMDRNYSKGSCNLIYLGEVPHNLSLQTAEVLERMCRRIHAMADKCSPEAQDIWWRFRVANGDLNLADVPRWEEFDALESLYSSPWFTRVWVVQEAFLSADNRCFFGDVSFPLSHAALIARLAGFAVTGPSNWKNVGLKGLRSALDFHGDANLSIRFDTLMACARASEKAYATDRRDSLYGLLGLWKQANGVQVLPALLQPSYVRTADEVFRDATRHCLMTEDDSLLIATVTQAESEPPSPTWAYQFDRKRGLGHVGPIAAYETRPRCGFSRSQPVEGASSLNIADTHDPQVLRIKGFLLSTVEYVLEPLSPFIKRTDVLVVRYFVVTILDRVDKVFTQKPSAHGSSLEQAARLLTCGSFFRSGSIEYRTSALSQFLNHLSEKQTFPEFSHSDPAGVFFRLIFSVMGRPFFVTPRGLGFGPPTMRQGDIVCVAINASYPYILRGVGNDFEYVGAAYMPEIMNGEVFELGVHPTWVNIR